MTEFKIEKGVPLPPRPGNNAAKYPWAEMEVGDSFFVPGKTQAHLSGCIANQQKTRGFKFSARGVEGGVRVWRIE